ncbi:hypothetical protein V9T40_012270 [Parthenolecanium corni]|uniref:CRAL-TRIO domain-containing protein n=1 Tax=Parthenolecanium corni TaxID=536013 RepID=A0AAN9TAD8_9HEMI
MFLEKCSERQIQEIYQEFNITEQSLKRDVSYLIEWMEKQPHLPNVKDEQYLSHELVQCKNSIEKTKKLLDSYYCTKAMLPVLFTKRDPTDESYRLAFNIGCAVPLPKLTPEGHRVFIFRNFSAEKNHLLTADDYMKMNYMNLDISIRDDFNNKQILIYDIQNVNMNLITTIFNSSRKYMNATQSLYAFRVHKVHLIINWNSTFSIIFKVIKSLVKKKLFDRVVIWNNERPDFTSMFPVEILPEEYGGKEKPLKQLHEMYYQYICEFREWLKSEETVVADLAKRTDDLYKTSVDESVDGSFRQLIID